MPQSSRLETSQILPGKNDSDVSFLILARPIVQTNTSDFGSFENLTLQLNRNGVSVTENFKEVRGCAIQACEVVSREQTSADRFHADSTSLGFDAKSTSSVFYALISLEDNVNITS